MVQRVTKTSTGTFAKDLRARLTCGWRAGTGICGLAVLLGLPVAAAQAARAPSTVAPGASCVTAECHAQVERYRYTHWEDFEADCGDCHAQKGDKHAFSVPDAEALCPVCHEAMVEGMMAEKTVHYPVEDGCFECHNPHGSNAQGLLKTETQRELCFGCHEESIVGEKYKHGPADQGACTMCHSPHASSNSTLLLQADVASICAECHEQHAEAMWSAKYQHDFADCIDCHNPHSSPNPKMLLGAGRRLCAECHEDIVDTVDRAAVDHAPTSTGKECVNCHSTHGANAAPMLLAPQRELCLGCHDKKLESGETTLANMKSLLDHNEHWHKPIQESGCTGCHQPHGSDHFRLLKKPFPEKFYSPFDLTNYALCFSCHEQSVVQTERTRTLTNFRDGDRSLHFLHVNREKGRTCRACHEPHASPHLRHIRDTVPFGKWALPVNFEKNETGGKCHPGCHDEFTYDRNAPNYSEE